MAAELLATNSTVEGIGVLFDSAVRLSRIGRQQIKYCVDDGREILEKLQAADTGDEYIDAFFGHMGRRIGHVASGVESAWRIVGDAYGTPGLYQIGEV